MFNSQHIYFAPQHCSTTLRVSSEMEAAAVPPSVWRKDTWHITLQRKELEPLQMKVRMLYLDWMFWPFVFNVSSQQRRAGTSLFCSIPFKHATSGKRETRSRATSSLADSCLFNQRVLINPSIVPHMSISTKGYRGEINVRINSKGHHCCL